MATAGIASQPHDRSSKRRPFTDWVKRIATRKHGEQTGTSHKILSSTLLSSKHRKANGVKNNPYPASGFMPRTSPRSSIDGALSFATSNRNAMTEDGSIRSEPTHERDGHGHGTRSGAPTLNTKPETLRSGYSRAATTNTAGGAVSSIDGAGGGSTFSSPSQSLRSLTTTLTTIQSTGVSNALHSAGGSYASHNQTIPHSSHFSHQYPISPVSSLHAPSAIPRHVSEAHSTAASNTLTDNASILTLASSSKRRRRSMDTDASVRALAPSSVWGGSRESLPLSVLSSNIEPGTQARPPASGYASAERASVYSSSGIAALASDRNSYYAGATKKDVTSDAKSLRSLNNLDSRSQYDARSMTEGRADVGSIKGYESSIRSGALGHNRHDSISGSIGASAVARQPQGTASRRSSDWTATDTADAKDAIDGDEGGQTSVDTGRA